MKVYVLVQINLDNSDIKEFIGVYKTRELASMAYVRFIEAYDCRKYKILENELGE